MSNACGFPSIENCEGPLWYIDNPAHVRGLASGGHTVLGGKVFLCQFHADLVCTEMAQRGVHVIVRPLPA